MFNSEKHSFVGTYCNLDVLDSVIEEIGFIRTEEDPLKICLISSQENTESQVKDYSRLLNSAPTFDIDQIKT